MNKTPEIIYISHFDDGKQRYKKYPNKWMVMGNKFGGDKLILKNADDQDIVISSISSWKTTVYPVDSVDDTDH